ncbi:MAG TPA: hypothetical protein VIX18_11805, partial [Nitrospirota bacterium]
RRETRIFFGFFLVCLCAGLEAPPVTQILHVLPLFDMTLNDRLRWAAMLFLGVYHGARSHCATLQGERWDG